MKEFIIGKNDSGQRLDRFLTKQGLTIGVIRKALRNKDIKVSARRESADYKLIKGDVLKVYVQNEFFSKDFCSKDFCEFENISSEINIVYEDENILLADKPAGLLCHSGNENNTDNSDYSDTLINRIKAYLFKKGEFNPDNEHYFEPALCNRIDRNTGGIVIAAKNAESLRVINEMIKQRQVKKIYLCLLCNVPQKKSAVLTAFLEKDHENNKVKITNKKTGSNRTIITKYRILDERKGIALAEIDLLTGRTHQIRAHMAYIGCPLLGDGKYGKNQVNKQYGFDKQALYSYKLMFDFKEKNHLDYLHNRSFEAAHIPFIEKFKSL